MFVQSQGNKVKGKEKMIVVYFFYKDIFFSNKYIIIIKSRIFKEYFEEVQFEQRKLYEENYIHNIYT